MCNNFNFQKLHQGYWGLIRLLRVLCEIEGDGCAWLCGVFFFFFKFDFFLQQKLVIIVLELQLCDWGFVKGWVRNKHQNS